MPLIASCEASHVQHVPGRSQCFVAKHAGTPSSAFPYAAAHPLIKTRYIVGSAAHVARPATSTVVADELACALSIFLLLQLALRSPNHALHVGAYGPHAAMHLRAMQTAQSQLQMLPLKTH